MPAITIRRADVDPEGADSRLIWAWRNDPVTRQMSRTTEAIPWERHAAWYAGTGSHIVMVLVDDTPAAMIRFDPIDARHAEVNINVSPAVRGRGLGAPILTAGCDYGFTVLGLAALRAEVKSENAASIKIFEKAGFVLESERDGLRRYQRERGRDG